MGGNAIKKVKVERINKDLYQLIKSNIIEKLSQHLHIDFFFDTPNKTDFGDLDVIYINTKHICIYRLLNEIYEPIEIVTNGNVISFSFDIAKYLYTYTNTNIQYFQVDLIKCSDISLIPMYKFFFSYGDFGMIFGRIANYYSIKFGHEGLWINLMKSTLDSIINKSSESNTESNTNIDITQVIVRIDLTSDPRQICEYLSYDYDRWLEGFDSVESIFKYLCSSKLFKKEIFNSSNADHRKRFKVRPLYAKFLDYIGADIQQFIGSKMTSSHGEIGTNMQEDAIIYFDKLSDINVEIEKMKIKQNRVLKFNGKMIVEKISELGNFTPDKIGYHIKHFTNYIISIYKIYSTFDEYLDDNNITKINVKNDLDLYFLTAQ
jgi:hypothetical protein